MNQNGNIIAVQCRDVQKSFGQGNAVNHALASVNLDVFAGELLMLVGPSGCGKTTLLSVIAGILNHDGGDIHLFGQNLLALGNNAKARFRGHNVGFAFQQFNLLPQLTAVENAAVPLLVLGWPRRKALDRAGDFLDKMGLGTRLKSYPPELSGGQQQRIAFARALVHEPKLVVCDEPTSALDGKTGEQVIGLLKALAVRPDRAVIVVTHDSRIFHFSDRIAHMEDGRIVDTVITGNIKTDGEKQ